MGYFGKPWEYLLDLKQAERELQAEYDANIISEKQYREELAEIYRLMDKE